MFQSENLVIMQKNWTKSAIKFSLNALVYLISYIGLNIFCKKLSEKIFFTSTLGPGHLKFTISVIFNISEAFLAFKLGIQSNGDVTHGCIFIFWKSTISYFIFKYKCGTKCQLNCNKMVSIKRSSIFLAQQECFELSWIPKEIGSRRKVSR